VFSHGAAHEEHHVGALVHGIMIIVPLLGIAVSYLFYMRGPEALESLMRVSAAQRLHRFWFSHWGMDALYDALLVKPFMWLARINRRDLVDSITALLIEISQAGNSLAVRLQTGSLRWYALMLAGSLVALVTIMMIGSEVGGG
jgi:NADH-quinone oxidoreductase subunit L